MKGLVWVLVAIGALVGGFYLFNNYIYEEKQGDGNTYEPYRATLSGEYLCLPHVDTSGPQTLECAFGLKTDDGTYYALDFNLMSQAILDLQTGQHISASGVVTPIERLSTDHWQKYPIVGIFSVTDSLARVGENPEGEADPSRMTLEMQAWNWISTLYNDEREIRPSQPGKFTLLFEDGKILISTDCNSGSTSYVTASSTISFGPIVSTKMFCEGSQETEFFTMIANSTSYHFTSRGELILDLKFDSGSVTLR